MLVFETLIFHFNHILNRSCQDYHGINAQSTKYCEVMENSMLEHDHKSLLEILLELLKVSSENDEVPATKFDCKDGFFLIHHVPPHFQHPLSNIVSTIKKSFFLVSKLPTPKINHEESVNEEEYEIDVDNPEPALHVITQRRVTVATPIPQKLYHLFHQKDLHLQEGCEVQKLLDITNLEKLELKYARYFLSLYTHCRRALKDLPEVWLLCDQHNHQKVSFMGMVPCDVPAGEKCENSGQMVNTVLVRNENLDLSKKDSSILSDQKKKHMVFNKASHAETHGYAKYHIYGTTDNFPRNGGRPESSITVEFAWDGVSKMLQAPPPSSNAVLNICVHPEDARTILSDISNELDLLVHHFAMVQRELAETDEVEDEKEDGHDEEKVLKFLDDLKHNSFKSNEGKKTESLTSSPGGNIAAPFGISEALQRQDLDNTEYLWLFLKDFTCQNKIMFCLKIIFNALFEDEYHPILHATNQTRIAKLMKEMFYCKNNVEKAGVKAKITNALTRLTALQCVVDIGLEKLRNDYTNYFIKQELVTKDKLEYYLAQDIPMAEKIQRLLKLHCIVALVALAIPYARITYDGLRKLVAASLKFYEEHAHTEHPVFALSLPAFSASSASIKNACIHQFQPQVWVVAITTMNEYITILQLESNDFGLESFIDQDKAVQNNYLTSTATVSQIHI